MLYSNLLPVLKDGSSNSWILNEVGGGGGRGGAQALIFVSTVCHCTAKTEAINSTLCIISTNEKTTAFVRTHKNTTIRPERPPSLPPSPPPTPPSKLAMNKGISLCPVKGPERENILINTQDTGPDKRLQFLSQRKFNPDSVIMESVVSRRMRGGGTRPPKMWKSCQEKNKVCGESVLWWIGCGWSKLDRFCFFSPTKHENLIKSAQTVVSNWVLTSCQFYWAISGQKELQYRMLTRKRLALKQTKILRHWLWLKLILFLVRVIKVVGTWKLHILNTVMRLFLNASFIIRFSPVCRNNGTNTFTAASVHVALLLFCLFVVAFQIHHHTIRKHKQKNCSEMHCNCSLAHK